MFEKMYNYMKKPKLYENSTFRFWDDEHVSKGLLEAHLDSDFEAASRNKDFMDSSVEWIWRIAPAQEYKRVLDLGCGPGFYADRFTDKGYLVTGIDFSGRSIEFAKEDARVKNQDIEYIYMNYLDIDYNKQFDLVTLIFCDFGVLSEADRILILKKIHKALRVGGRAIIDVSSHREFEGKKENSSWYISEGGFWKPDRHICLESHIIYENNIRLDQFIIIDSKGKVDTVRNWFKPFTREEIVAEFQRAGFDKVDVYSDVAGRTYTDDSKTICVVVEK